MKLWIDDVRKPPNQDYTWLYSVNQATNFIRHCRKMYEETAHPMWKIEVISLDHDAAEFFVHGGDYIEILKWLEKKGWSYPIHIHSMNPVGVQNMRAIIEHNGWKEVYLDE